MIDDQPEDIMQLFFKVIDFLSEETNLYHRHAINNDYKSYSDGVLIAFDRFFDVHPPEDKKKSKSKIEPPPSAKNPYEREIKKT